MKKISKVLLGVMILSLIMTNNLLSMHLVNATTVFKKDENPIASVGQFTPRMVTDNDYEEATNSFKDGNVKYYLVTHDQASQGKTEVTYKGETYNLSGVYVFNTDTVNFNQVVASDGTQILGGKGASNITVFFDDGEYIDGDATGYTAFSRENTSYVGLNIDGDGNPLAVVSRIPRPTPAVINGCIERNIINKQNVYFENLIFDGKSHDMVPVEYKDGKKKKKYRGEYFFHINGSHNKATDGFVMRDVIIRNVGDNDRNNDGSFSYWGGDTRRKNVAINIHYNPGKVNIENVKIKNIATASNLGVVQVQDGDATYLKDIEVDMSRVSSNVYPVKVETTPGEESSIAQQNATISSLTTKNVVNSIDDCIYVQDYKYDFVKVPKNYKYAVWSSSNGSYINSAIKIYKGKQTASKLKAIQDLRDNYWVVDTNSTEATIEEQLLMIARVMKYSQEDVEHQKSPNANIKFVGSNIPSFAVPAEYVWSDFTGTEHKEPIWQNKDDSNMDIEIVAVRDFDTVVSDTTKELIPVVEDAIITLPENKNVRLYNFDFAKVAKYTMYEAVNGIVPLTKLRDPNEASTISNYPKYATYAPTATVEPKVKNSNKDTYKNCKFTTLNKEIAIKDKVNKSEIQLGTSVSLESAIINGTTFDDNGVNIGAKEEVDDTSVIWVSGDESKATVDQNGVVSLTANAVAGDEFTIYVKATDKFNNGEIEKPFDDIKMTVIAKPNPNPITVDLITSVDGGHGTISPSKYNLIKNSQEIVIFTPENGYEIESVLVNGVDKTADVKNNQLIVFMNEDKNVKVKYRKIKPVDEDIIPTPIIPDKPETPETPEEPGTTVKPEEPEKPTNHEGVKDNLNRLPETGIGSIYYLYIFSLIISGLSFGFLFIKHRDID